MCTALTTGLTYNSFDIECISWGCNIWLQIFHTFFFTQNYGLEFLNFYLPLFSREEFCHIDSEILNKQKSEAKQRPIKDHKLEMDQVGIKTLGLVT